MKTDILLGILLLLSVGMSSVRATEWFNSTPHVVTLYTTTGCTLSRWEGDMRVGSNWFEIDGARTYLSGTYIITEIQQ